VLFRREIRGILASHFEEAPFYSGWECLPGMGVSLLEGNEKPAK
jgi:hypothetical protein